MTSSGNKNSGANTRATDGMGGDGYYDSHSEVQNDAVRGQTERLRNAVRHLDMTASELRIMDYGCGPGRNSMAAFHAVLDEVRSIKPDMPVVAVHNDQIGNDWNDLFSNIRGPDGYLHDIDHIRAEASAGSFFEPAASPGTVDLGMSFMAAHWLDSTIRLASPGTLFFADMTGPARREIADIADRHWTTFFRRRAREVNPGGWLVIETMSSVPDPDDPSGLRAGGRRLYRAFWQVAEGMAGEGLIDPTLLNGFVFPLYFREEHEVRAPFERETDLNDAFEIVELTSELFATPYEVELQKNGDAAIYAASFASFARGFSESSFRNGLFDGSASSAADADRLADMFFDRLETLFRNEPGRHAFENQSMSLVLRRR